MASTRAQLYVEYEKKKAFDFKPQTSYGSMSLSVLQIQPQTDHTDTGNQQVRSWQQVTDASCLEESKTGYTITE